MKVRFFGGFGFDENMLGAADLAHQAYEGGVPMGGDLVGTGEAPAFIAWAQRDPNGNTLQRLQVVKVTSEGEEVIDVACDNGTPDPSTKRCTRITSYNVCYTKLLRTKVMPRISAWIGVPQVS